ncbi:MAG: alpha/beta hydrolase [Pelagibacteraceae bacterium TMED287]|nr:MAG: alpha/beta hydrolase [Pelagibacteraceae bacterium TMED287]
MKKFKYLKITKTEKLRYLSNYFKKNIYIVFLPGFQSDITGEKPQAFYKYAKKNKLGFLAIEYYGHGKSSGKFTKGNISRWSNDVKFSIKKLVKKNNFILIGSSMGAWLSIIQFKYFKRQIKGLIGIGSAPEFLSRLMWNKFPKKIKREITNKGITEIKNGGYTYLISKQLIDDGKKNKVFKKRINSKINVTMFHGSKDEVVPVNFSRKVLKIFTKAKKKIVIIKKGNHSLSSRNSIKKILKELDRFKILNL